MPKNYNRRQTERNNRCGGYALDSLLCDMGIINNPMPLQTYKGIQDEQLEIVNDAASQQLLDSTCQNDTNFSFPSAIVRYAIVSYGHNPIVNMGQLPNQYSDEIIAAEMQRILNENVEVGTETLAAVLDNPNYHHHLVLVKNGTHWISVVKDNGSLYMYDPGVGGFNATTIQNLLQDYSGIVITLD